MPVRRIPMGRRSLTGRHNWNSRARGVAFESSLERDFISLMLLDLGVASIEEQPVEVKFVHQGAKRSYIPDFLVKFRQGRPKLIEIKYADELVKKAEELLPKFEAAAAYAKERGWTFEVWTDDDIRTPRLENAKVLVPLIERKVDAGLAARIVNRLVDVHDGMRISELLGACWNDKHERARGLRVLWHLVATRRIAADLDTQLNEDSIVRMKEKNVA